MLKSGAVVGICLGVMFFCIIGTNALGFWYGSVLISDNIINSSTEKVYKAGDVLKVFFAIIMGAF